jgi:hypothetical protein
VNIGLSGAIGKKDKPARVQKTSEYHKQLEWAERRFVVFYEPGDRRAWLVDGLSALLHLVRAHITYRKDKGLEVIFKDEETKEPDAPHTGKKAAGAFLRNRDNMNLRIAERWNRPVYESSTEGNNEPKVIIKRQQTFEHLVDLVGDLFGILSILFDFQEDASTADGFGARVRVSSKRYLDGWDFSDVATLKETVWPKTASLLDTGLAWNELVGSIPAVTLFGVGFGEIVQPKAFAQSEGDVCEEKDERTGPSTGNPLADGPNGDAPLHAITPGSERDEAVSVAVADNICTQWPCLPKGKDFLATTIAVIEDIRENMQRGPPVDNDRFWLTTNLYWHAPDKAFKKCHCGKGKPCDRVQTLLSAKSFKAFARAFQSPYEPLPVNGALIFGHSGKSSMRWPPKDESATEEDSVGQLPRPLAAGQGLQLSPPSDSGLGTSVSSSARGGASSRTDDDSDGRRSIRKLFSRSWSRLSVARWSESSGKG